MATLEQTTRAVANFAGTIRAKREVLQTLYYAAKNSWTEALALRQRLKAVPPLDLTKPRTPGDDDLGYTEFHDDAVAAEATAQDSAAAFMIICDYSLRRLRTEGDTVDTRTIGADAYNGVKLNKAIWALANQARHLDKWQQNDWHRESYEALVALDLFPTYDGAARLFLERLNLPSYLDFEERLTMTVHDVLKPAGLELTRTRPGTVRISMKGLPPTI